MPFKPFSHLFFASLLLNIGAVQAQTDGSSSLGACLAEAPQSTGCLQEALGQTGAARTQALLNYLRSNPQGEELPVAWLQPLMRPELLKSLLPALSDPDIRVRQHVLLLYRQALALQPPVLSPGERDLILQAARQQLTEDDPVLRVLALDLHLSQQPEPLGPLKLALASTEAPERALALYHVQNLPPSQLSSASREGLASVKQVLTWLNGPDHSLALLSRWTRYTAFQAEADGQALSLHGFLARWLAGPGSVPKALTEPAVLLLLQHPHAAVRRFALQRLARSGESKYQPRLEALLEDPDESVRMSAYEALELLQQQVPKQYLASLKNPARLPSDAEARIKTLMRDPGWQRALLDPAYVHLASLPVYGDELWRLAASHPDEQVVAQTLAQIQRLPATWPVTRLEPLLAPQQAPNLRQQALQMALQRPASSERQTLLRSLLNDPDIHLPLEILNSLFLQGAQSDARMLLELLSLRRQERVNLTRLSFDGRQGHEQLEDWMAKRLKNWILKSDRQGLSWGDWLNWARNNRLPRSWRREIVRLIGDKGRNAAFLPLLRGLRNDPDLGFDAGFAMDAVENRL
ncbi:MAG: HEAT repeat domain-containing protein [Candidatus Sericytochromatia bacterium]